MAFPIVPAAFGLTQLLGGLFGHQKGIDMKEWERLFGPAAQQGLTNQFFKQFQNSPFAAQQNLAASNTGQQIANNYAAMPGARDSGVGQISQALSTGATNSLQSQLMAMLFQMAQQAAQQNLASKENIFLHNQQQPSFLNQLGQAVTGAAGQTLSMLPTKNTATPSPSAPAPGSVPSGAFTPKAPAPLQTYQQTSNPFDLSRFDIFANRAVGAGR